MKKFFSRFGYPIELFLPKNEKFFLIFIIACFSAAFAGVIAGPQVGMWVGFAFAAYAAVANDSIQTIGTFIASNQNKKWWVLWIFLGSIFLGTIAYSWLTVDKTGLTVFYPNEKSEHAYTKTINNEEVSWTKDDFKKLDRFLEEELQFDITEENGVSTIKLVSEKTFYLDGDSIVFSTNPIIHSTKAIETYGISLVLEKTENTGSFYSISEISKDTNSEATYTFGGDSEIVYNNGKSTKKVKYKKTGHFY